MTDIVNLLLVIDIHEVNTQLQTFAPGFVVYEHTPIDIQFLLPDMIEKDIYLICKKINFPNWPYIKVDKNGKLKEIYPSINENWQFIDTLPSIKMQIKPIDYCPGTLPYASFNVSENRIDHLYYAKTLNTICRVDIDTYKLNRTYYKQKDARADICIYYHNEGETEPAACLLSWTAFNKDYVTVRERHICC